MEAVLYLPVAPPESEQLGSLRLLWRKTGNSVAGFALHFACLFVDHRAILTQDLLKSWPIGAAYQVIAGPQVADFNPIAVKVSLFGLSER